MSGAWDSSQAPARRWRAGAWSLELRDDEIADVAHDGVVVLRAVRAVVRDRDWGTPAMIVRSVSATATGLALDVRSHGLGSSFAGTVRVEVLDDTLAVTCDLVSAEDFATNRTGLVVLHPPTLAGSEVVATHPGGEETTRFPRDISPHQPVRDITGLAWRQAGLTVALRFDGDVFEMEDQRNWTDASYKTYSRPLSLPFPYPIAAGEHVRQTLRVSVRRDGPPARPSPSADRIELLPFGNAFPTIAVGAATAPDPAPSLSSSPDRLLVELDLVTANWRAALARAAATGAALDVRLVLDEQRPASLDEAAAALDGLPLTRITAFAATGPASHVSDAATIDLLRAALLTAGVDVPVVGGVRSHFTELNREHHRVPDGLAGVVFSLTPLFHDRSTEQLVESVAMQRLVAEQAVAIADGLPVHIGPVTLRPRFNNVATVPPPGPVHDDLREGYGPQIGDADDARQATPELAAWMVASAAALAIPGVETLTYFEEWGPRGVRSSEGAPYPVADVAAALRGFGGSETLTGPSPDGLVWAVGVRTPTGAEVLAANLGRLERTILIATPMGECVITLAAGTFGRAGLLGRWAASDDGSAEPAVALEP